jgi:translation initiation factor IF-2
MANTKEKQIVEIPEYISVREVAELIHVSPIEVMKHLIKNGIMATINQQIDFDTAAIVVEELGFEARPVILVEETVEDDDSTPQWRRLYSEEDPRKLEVRPPVVTILGHVDHGKTSLLDSIRRAHVADGEFGGITQHIGAYQVTHTGRKITFLDTPGHALFTAMRARGAQGADIAVLVVAADDGVMETTKEAVAHARAAKVPIVVALNKIDKPNANPDRVKQELSDIGLLADEWGGDTMVIPVSARNKVGIDDLLEAIILTAEESRIIANPKGKVAGTVLEAEMDKNKGILATLLVQNGTLRVGDVVITGTSAGRVRAMFDENGKSIQSAPPSTPARVMGLAEMPQSGDLFILAKNEKEARLIVEQRKQEIATANVRVARVVTLDDIYKQMKQGEVKELNLILKADVQGSLEPIVNGLNNLTTPELGLKIVHRDIGNISENDVNLAVATRSIILGFQVNIDVAARRLSESNGVDIRLYNIIYQLFEDVEKALKGMLDPVYVDKVIGTAEVKQLFKVQGSFIAGCVVRDGEIKRNSKTRVRRGREILVDDLTVASLKRGIEDVREVRAGIECGIRLDGFDQFRVGDQIDFLVKERVS